MGDIINKTTLPAECRRFRLGIWASDFQSPFALLRVNGPFEFMRKEDERLDIVYPPTAPDGRSILDWNWIIQCDMVFYHHPLHDAHIGSIALARMMGKAVWIELTDDPFSVQPSNPAYMAFRDLPAVRENIGSAMDMANVITVTSETLKEALLRNICEGDDKRRAALAPKIFIVPEACFYPPSDLPRKKVISWRGLVSHDEDTAGVMQAAARVAKDFPEWTWVLFGEPNPRFVDALKSASGEKNVKVSPYWPTPFHATQAWAGTAPYVHIVPLGYNAFNLSKSHLAYLEATAVGAGVIVPDYLPEWQQPGVIAYSDGKIAGSGKKDFEQTLREALLTYKDGEKHPNVATARAVVMTERTLPAINQLRWKLLAKFAR